MSHGLPATTINGRISSQILAQHFHNQRNRIWESLGGNSGGQQNHHPHHPHHHHPHQQHSKQRAAAIHHQHQQQQVAASQSVKNESNGDNHRKSQSASPSNNGLTSTSNSREASNFGLRVTRNNNSTAASMNGNSDAAGQDEEEVKSFYCPFCQCIFLDSVVHAIHMGCHELSDPLKCNLCGHRSSNIYQFYSHLMCESHVSANSSNSSSRRQSSNSRGSNSEESRPAMVTNPARPTPLVHDHEPLPNAVDPASIIGNPIAAANVAAAMIGGDLGAMPQTSHNLLMANGNGSQQLTSALTRHNPAMWHHYQAKTQQNSS